MLHEPGTGEPDLGTTVGGGEPRGCWLHKLQHDLARRLRARVRAVLDPEHLAGETVLRAWLRFGPSPDRSWSTIWSWSLTTASNLVVSGWRAQRRLEPLVDDPAHRECCEEGVQPSWFATLEEAATKAQRQVLALMARGITNSRELASLLGCSVRAVEFHRQGLRALLSGAGNVCRRLRSRASMEVKRQRVASPADEARGTTC